MRFESMVIRLTCHWVAKISGTCIGTYFLREIGSTLSLRPLPPPERGHCSSYDIIRLTCHWVAKISGTYMGTYFDREIGSSRLLHNFLNIDPFLTRLVPLESSPSQLRIYIQKVMEQSSWPNFSIEISTHISATYFCYPLARESY